MRLAASLKSVNQPFIAVGVPTGKNAESESQILRLAKLERLKSNLSSKNRKYLMTTYEIKNSPEVFCFLLNSFFKRQQ